MTRALTVAEAEAIRGNLFPPIAASAVAVERFPWHRDRTGRITADRLHSSQALAVSVFSAISSRPSRDRILQVWARAFGIADAGRWNVQLERLVPGSSLGEPRSTQIDASAESDDALILFECKFTEQGGGTCSQVDRLRDGAHAGLTQCDGSYRLQRNIVNGRSSRCALTGKGVRYWEIVPSVLDLSNDIDHTPCPFRGGWFQWMRNLVACSALAGNKAAAVGVVYADGPFPMAREVRSDEWKQFMKLTDGRRVRLSAISYQELLALGLQAADVADRTFVADLQQWVNARVKAVAGEPVDTRNGSNAPDIAENGGIDQGRPGADSRKLGTRDDHKGVLAIGWDVGGWEGKRHGLAALAVRDGVVNTLGAFAVRFPRGAEGMGFEEFVRWTAHLLGFSYSGERVILAVDAPFGFPNAFRALLNGTPATHWHDSGQISNPYAYRQTDRVVHQRFKTPLSASFDKLGNNATVAMHCLAAWRKDSHLQVLPFDEPDAERPVAIEVYPALIRTSATGARPDWYRLIAPAWVETTGDASDAVVCAALAMAWARPGQWGLPMLAPPPADLPPGEGWIFYPAGQEWKPKAIET